MKRMNKILAAALAIALWASIPGGTALAENEMVTDIDLASAREAPGVKVESIVENHPDVAEEYAQTANTVFTITENGIYRFTGELENGQIRVDAPQADDIQIILNGVTLTNRTAPALYIKNAFETGDPSLAAVRIHLQAGTHNVLNGSHYARHTDSEGNEIDHDGAVSSAVSLVIEGEGALQINADNEGIEGLMHLIFNGGDISILSGNDAINGSGDNESHIVINAGRIAAKSILGKEGDGIDSNGSITVNGGTVIAIANPNSMDSGLDSDLGITINGGIVAASGSMYDEISPSSPQRFIHLVFTAPGEAGTPVVLTDEDGRAVIAFAPSAAYTQMTLSAPGMTDGLYQVYKGGSLDGEAMDGLYPSGNAYAPGTLQQNGGSTRETGRPDGPNPRDGQRPEGTPPESIPEGEPPALPETMPDGQLPQPPQGMEGQPPMFGRGSAPSPSPGGVISTDFFINSQSYYFIGVEDAKANP
ncbi:MAG: carbohydrate-binding domain-containing protein [Clostridia bacterium]|nr:carbohydrate-binding domain-containing protein [Clostridia bacterium]